MDRSLREVFQGLDSAISEWKSRAFRTHLNLSRHFSEIKRELVEVLAGMSGSSPEFKSEIDNLKRMVSSEDEAFQGENESASSNATGYGSEETQGPPREVPQGGNNIVEELDRALRDKVEAQQEIETLRAELERARNEAAASRALAQRAEKLEEEIHAEEARISELRKQIDEQVRNSEEARKVIEKLRAEVELLRLANSSLARQGAGEEAARAATKAADIIPEASRFEASLGGGKRRKLGDILVVAGIITEEQLENALDRQETSPQRHLGRILVENGLVAEEVVAQVLAAQADFPFIRLTEHVIDDAATRLIGGQLARRHMCIPIRATAERLVLATANPFDLVALEDIERASGLHVDAVVATESAILASLERHYGSS